MVKIIVGASHVGGAKAIIPVAQKLAEKYDVLCLGGVHSNGVFEQSGLDFLFTDLESGRGGSFVVNPGTFFLTGTNSYDDQNGLDRILTWRARERNLPVVSVLDLGTQLEQRFDDVEDKRLAPYWPSALAVPDSATVNNINRILDDRGLDVRVEETGNPAFDRLKKRSLDFFLDKGPERIRAELGVSSPKNRLIMFGANAWKKDITPDRDYWDLDVLHKIVGTLNRLVDGTAIGDKTLLAVNLHPRMPAPERAEVERYINQLEKRPHYEVRLMKPGEYDSIELGLASDLVLGEFSTMLLEFTYMGFPVASVQPGIDPEKDQLITNKVRATPLITTSQQLDNFIGTFFTRLDRQKYMAEVAPNRKNFTTDGQATERVLSLVHEYL
ncbi:MAG: hypothetical protein ABIH51_00935 [Patescibacteria group bacterium]